MLDNKTIAMLVRNGIPRGIGWSIYIEDEGEDYFDHVAELIKEGYTSGREPYWELTIKEHIYE